MSAIDRLRQNRPARTSFCIALRDERSDAELAQALEQNPFVTEIDLNLNGARHTNWNSLLLVLSTRANLETVILRDGDWGVERNAPVGLVRSILRAIQQNSAVQRVDLNWLRLPIEIVDTASSITSLSLFSCILEPSVDRDQGPRDLADALQRNTNIKRLQLAYLDEVCNFAILQGLQSNTSLETLVFGHHFSDATAEAMQQLLESTRSIRTVGLRDMIFGTDKFRTLAQTLTQSSVVCGLKFLKCDFGDEEAATLFRNILLEKRNLTDLSLDQCSFIRFQGGGQVHEAIVSTLSRRDSPLRSFELKERSLSFRDALPNPQFQNLLGAVEKSKLEHFAIGSIQSHEQLRNLTDSIPKMRIKELQVEFSSPRVEENDKQLLLLAVKNNFSLRSVDGNRALPGLDLFDANHKTRLVFYTNRNERLDQWVDNPETVIEQRKVWPDALKLAEKAGPNSLFRGLRSVLGGDGENVKLRGGRKRKRPQYDAPS